MVRNFFEKIIDEQKIFTSDEIMELNFTEEFIDEMFASCEVQNIFLTRLGIIPNFARCTKCPDNPYMRYVKKNLKIDGYAWICKRPCTSTKSIRQKTPFISSRLKFKTIFRLMYKYINNLNLGDIAHELNIGKNTVTEYADMIRTLIVNYITTSNDKIGGYDQDNQPIYVEIDESLFFKAKYNRGAHFSGQWYVGGVERGTKRAFIVPVVDRTKETMINVVSENVHPGSIIITDEWQSYRSALDEIGVYTHSTVNHSLNFIDPVIHTQKIEGFWSLIKRYLRHTHGINQSLHYEYLLQFMLEFRVQKRKRLNTLLLLLKLKD